MFHLASVILWGVLQPLNLIGILLAASLGAVFLGLRRISIVFGVLALVLLALCCWTSFGAMLMQPLEARFERPDPLPPHVDGIVVLGGGFEGRINLARGGYELGSSGDRYVETAILARRYPQAQVLVSGGSGSIFLKAAGDGETAPHLLVALGVSPDRLLIENSSRDTFENAQFSRALAKPQADEVWLLVTSAFHMPRAVGVFRQVGYPVVPWPTDYRTTGGETVRLAVDNAIDSLENSTLAIREWLGLLAYWLAGRTDSLLPVHEHRSLS